MTGGTVGAADALGEALAARGLVLEDQIARGGAATVYRARDARHGRPVAVKVFGGSSAGVETDRFAREVALVAQLRHPNVLPLFDSGEAADGRRYYVMPLVEGPTLRDRIAAAGALPVPEALRVVREIGEALDYAHECGVVHRDVKPENILLEAGHAVLTDFGIAFVHPHTRLTPGGEADRSGSPGTRLTEAGFAVGTPEYMSPEQAAGERDVDGRSDIYSLGCVAYEALTGRPPFTGAHARDILARRFRESPAPLRSIRPEIPTGVDDAVLKALALDPADRFPSAAAFSAALEGARTDALSGRAAAARPLVSTVRRRALGGVAATSLAAAAAVALVQWRGGQPGVPPLDPHRVAVATLSNETGDSTLAPAGHVVADVLTGELAQSHRVVVVTSATVIPALADARQADDSMDDPERLHSLAAETRAGTVVSGSYFRTRDSLEFLVEVTDARTGDLVRTIGPVRSPVSAPDEAAAVISRRVAATLDSLLRPVPGFGPA